MSGSQLHIQPPVLANLDRAVSFRRKACSIHYPITDGCVLRSESGSVARKNREKADACLTKQPSLPICCQIALERKYAPIWQFLFILRTLSAAAVVDSQSSALRVQKVKDSLYLAYHDA